MFAYIVTAIVSALPGGAALVALWRRVVRLEHQFADKGGQPAAPPGRRAGTDETDKGEGVLRSSQTDVRERMVGDGNDP